MIAQIEDAIVSLLQTALADTRIAVQKGYEGIPQPAVYVSIEDARFHKVTMWSWKCEPTIYVDIIFKSLKTEQARRQGLYGILESCMQLLFLNNLGLDIHPLQPTGFRNITTEELLRDGFVAYSFTLTTHFIMTLLEPSGIQDLLTVSMNYYLSLVDENLTGGPDTPTAADTVEIEL